MLTGISLLTALIVWPGVAALLTVAAGWLVPSNVRVARLVAVGGATAELVLALFAIGPVVASGGNYALTVSHTWVPLLGINYTLGIDGVSLVLVLMSALVGLVALFTCNESVRLPQFYALLLLTVGAAMGIFLSLDLVLFYLFWEVVLIPVYLLMAGWGGPGRRAAAMKFLIMSLVGSLFMLVGITGLGASTVAATGGFVFDLPALVAAHASIAGLAGYLAFFAFALAFAIKSPLFPFHAWQPDAYVQAPTPVTILLSGVLSKAGAYAFLRFLIPLFPALSRQFADLFIVLGVAGVLYGAFIALGQRDMKRLMAYSSLSHMGLLVAGIFALDPIATQGAVLQMVSHGVVIAAVFAFIGMLEVRVGSRDLTAFGGLMSRAPILAGFGLMVALAALGLPGLSSFAGEFLLLVGLFQRSVLFASLAVVAVVLSAAYMLRLYQATIHGRLTGLAETVPGDSGRLDLRARDYVVLVPLLAVVVYLGIAPGVVPARVAPVMAHISTASPLTAPPQALAARSAHREGRS